MQVGVLGSLTVRIGDRDVTPRGQRLRDVPVVLLQRRGRQVPAEVLLDLVQGEAAVGLSGWRGPEPYADNRSELVEADRARLTELRAAAAEELVAILLEQPDTGGHAEALELATCLRVGCSLAELGHPDAADIIAAAMELTERVQLVMPPAMARKFGTAMQQLGPPTAGAPSVEPTASLLDRLDRTLSAVVEQLTSTPHVVA